MSKESIQYKESRMKELQAEGLDTKKELFAVTNLYNSQVHYVPGDAVSAFFEINKYKVEHIGPNEAGSVMAFEAPAPVETEAPKAKPAKAASKKDKE